MYCKFCGKQVNEGGLFCGSCGKSVNNNNNNVVDEGDVKKIFSNIIHRVVNVAGIETPAELKLSNVFSDVLKKHTHEEAEKLFIAGTAQTTPNIQNALDIWPKPWLFARIFLIIIICYFGLYVGFDVFENPNFLPGLIIMGSFMVPISLLIFFWEMNTPQNISIYEIIKILFIGGVISLIITTSLDAFVGEQSSSVIIIGIVEETAKLLPIIWVVKNRKYKYILNGLLIGAAIGAGFAAFESAGYALRTGIQNGTEAMYSIILLRGILAAGGHVVWASLSGAALFMVKGDRKFRWNMLLKIRFLRIFVIVMIMHSLWDMNFTASIMDIPIHMIILTLISWILVFAVISGGLKEISSLKNT